MPHRWIAGSKARRHVVFLGAGASATSGYPLANDLTLLMCDARTFQKRLKEVFHDDGDSEHDFHQNSVFTNYVSSSKAAAILRSGDFATMDELSKHAVGGDHADKVRELKKLMRLMLALHNPDDTHYSESDYRYLIQRLFVDGQLRKDVAVISYNYDPFFEHRLYRAFKTRMAVRPNHPQTGDILANAIHSGFLNPQDQHWLLYDSFCHLKLHGTCAFPLPPNVGKLTLPVGNHCADPFHAGYLFGFRAFPRLSALVQEPFVKQNPPAILPWEIMDEKKNRLLNEGEFTAAVGEDWEHRNLYPLYRGIWEHARSVVQRADKISLIGLSLGAYLEPGLRFLFQDKEGDVQFVIANPQNERFQNNKGQLHPNSPAGRAVEMLTQRCGMTARFLASFSEQAGFDSEAFEAKKSGEPPIPAATCYNTFREFIDNEM